MGRQQVLRESRPQIGAILSHAGHDRGQRAQLALREGRVLLRAQAPLPLWLNRAVAHCPLCCSPATPQDVSLPLSCPCLPPPFC